MLGVQGLSGSEGMKVLTTSSILVFNFLEL